MPTQLPRVPSLIPSSFATRAIGRDVSITIFTASSLNSGEKLFFGRGNSFTFPDFHPNGWTVRKPRGASDPEFAAMFRAEARVLASLDDPHVVRLYEYVESVSGAAIVMELIDGVSVRDIVSAQ